MEGTPMHAARFDFAAFGRALEQSHAEMEMIDRNRPPSAPLRLVGRPAVAVVSAMTLELRDGRIRRHPAMQAWDEVSCG